MNILFNIVVIKELQLENMNQYRKKDQMNYYEEKIIDNEIYSKVKDYSMKEIL